MKVRHTPGPGREALTATVRALDGEQGRVGWFPSAKHEKGQPVAGIAYVQEHGSATRNIPPRPFMRPAASEDRNDWSKQAQDISRAAVQGKIAPDQVMQAVTLAAEGSVRAAITKVTAPALSPKTVAARKRRLANGGKGAKASIAKPLVDTGLMLATLTSEVGKK